MKKNNYIFIILLFLAIIDCTQKKEVWYCPMHTFYHSDRPGKCPICNMDLVKQVEKNSNENSIEENKRSVADSIFLDEEKQALIGIKTFIVQKKLLKKSISTSGRVAYDPELYTAIMEYRDALQRTANKNEDDMKTNSIYLRSTKLRLRQLGLSDTQISEWSAEKNDPSVLVTGGNTGIAYVYSQIYESEIGIVRSGMAVEVIVDTYPDRVFHGKIKGIDTILDSKNRTLRIRSQVYDKANLLKPQMFADVNILLNLGNVISVPREAVMDTGKRKIVYIKLPGSRFIAREITTGNSTDDYYEIKRGLKPGEEVAIGANFLLDSESKLRLGNSEERGGQNRTKVLPRSDSSQGRPESEHSH